MEGLISLLPETERQRDLALTRYQEADREVDLAKAARDAAQWTYSRLETLCDALRELAEQHAGKDGAK